MKYAILILLAFTIATSVHTQSQYKPAIIGFYNLENFYDTIFHGSNDDISFTPHGSKAYTSTVFNDKVNKLATVLSQIGVIINPEGCALLGVAEVENKYVLDTLLKHPLMAKHSYKYVHYDSKDFRGVDVALIYNPKYFKVEKSLPLFVKIPAGAKTSMYTRDILWVKGLLDGERVHIFVNHWPSRAGGEKRSAPARMAAARTVRNFIDSLLIIDPGTKLILMGDFNDDPINSSITQGLKASGSIKDLKSDALYNPWLSMYKKGNGTLAYQDAWSLFDQIIISPSFLNKENKGYFFYKNNIFKAPYMIENTGRYKGYPMRTYNNDVYRGGYSDHFPTYIILLKKIE